MSSRQPPYPTGSDWRSWATKLVEFLTSNEPIEQETFPTPLQLPHRITGTEKALEDGLMMYDPVAGEPVFSKGGQWCKVSDGTPV